MSEAAPNISPAQIAALSPDGRTIAINAAAASGYSRAATQALFDATPLPAAQIQPNVVGMPGGEVPASLAPASTDAEGLARWRQVLDHSTLDKAVVVTEAAKSGYDLTHTPEMDAAASAVVAAQKHEAFVQETIASPEHASDYRIEWPNSATLTTEQLADQNSTYTRNFAKVGVPTILAPSLASALVETAAGYPELDPALTGFEEIAQAEGATAMKFAEAGAMIRALQNSPEIVKYADAAIAAIKKASPTWHAELYASKAFHSPAAYTQLAGLGRALELRGRAKK